MYEAQSQPTLLSPFSSPATQDASQDGLANAEDGVGIVGGVYGVTTPHKSKEQPPGLGREQETGSGRLQAADNALEAQEVSARTPSSGSSGEGSRRSRSSFTRSVAKLGREALENLADLQTAAQRAISGGWCHLYFPGQLPMELCCTSRAAKQSSPMLTGIVTSQCPLQISFCGYGNRHVPQQCMLMALN